jgi:hypothetical protein
MYSANLPPALLALFAVRLLTFLWQSEKLSWCIRTPVARVRHAEVTYRTPAEVFPVWRGFGGECV